MAGFPATGGHAPARRRKMGRPIGWTRDRRRNFLTMLRACLNVRRSVDAVGLTTTAAYNLKRRDPDFAREWAEALDDGYQNLELEMLRQAIEGSERTELVRESLDGPVKQVKIIHSYPHHFALRLMQAHQQEVLAFRLAGAVDQGEQDAIARVEAHMALVRERLAAAAEDEAEERADEAGCLADPDVSSDQAEDGEDR